MTFVAASATHTGHVRPHNEDAHLVGHRVFAVADGMGGHAAGEVASALAIAELTALDAADAPEAGDVVAAIGRANAAIVRYGDAHPEAQGLGTTLTGLVASEVDGQCILVVFNVGDSRVYRLSDGTLERVTRDHSEVGELVALGVLSEEEARTHPMRHIVTRALGTSDDADPTVGLLDPRVGDRFCICSDGLSDMLPDPLLERLLVAADDPEEAAEALVLAALEAGGHDNVTVVVVDVRP